MTEPNTSGRPGAGRLTVVGTPIGNLDDFSARGRAALKSADVIVCEDTRRTGRLLKHVGLAKTELLMANAHTEFDRLEQVVARVAAGQSVALVSDAGMPLVSDPGQLIVRAVLEAGLEVEVVPGPTALISALVLSGLATDRFVFEGFLPRKGADRATRLQALATEERTSVLYESPHRLERTMADLLDVCGPTRRAAVARELTKLHEEVVRGSLEEISARTAGSLFKGEIVIVLEPAAAPVSTFDDEELAALVASETAEGTSRRDAVALVSERLGISRRRVYQAALEAE